MTEIKSKNICFNILSAAVLAACSICLALLLKISGDWRVYSGLIACMVSVFLVFLIRGIVNPLTRCYPAIVYTLSCLTDLLYGHRANYNMNGFSDSLIDWLRVLILVAALYNSYRLSVASSINETIPRWRKIRNIFILSFFIGVLKSMSLLDTLYDELSDALFYEWYYCQVFNALFLCMCLLVLFPDGIMINRRRFCGCFSSYAVYMGALLILNHIYPLNISKELYEYEIIMTLISTFSIFALLYFPLRNLKVYIKDWVKETKNDSNGLIPSDETLVKMHDELETRSFSKEYSENRIFYNLYDIGLLDDIQEELICITGNLMYLNGINGSEDEIEQLCINKKLLTFKLYRKYKITLL